MCLHLLSRGWSGWSGASSYVRKSTDCTLNEALQSGRSLYRIVGAVRDPAAAHFPQHSGVLWGQIKSVKQPQTRRPGILHRFDVRRRVEGGWEEKGAAVRCLTLNIAVVIWD